MKAIGSNYLLLVVDNNHLPMSRRLRDTRHFVDVFQTTFNWVIFKGSRRSSVSGRLAGRSVGLYSDFSCERYALGCAWSKKLTDSADVKGVPPTVSSVPRKAIELWLCGDASTDRRSYVVKNRRGGGGAIWLAGCVVDLGGRVAALSQADIGHLPSTTPSRVTKCYTTNGNSPTLLVLIDTHTSARYCIYITSSLARVLRPFFRCVYCIWRGYRTR